MSNYGVTPQNPEGSKPSTSMTAEELSAQMQLRQIQANQNLGLGLVGGAVGACIGAAIWAGITAITNFQIGWMAVGVGFLTGFGVRTLGKGISPTFGVIGAILSLAGCLLGNLLSICVVISRQEGMPMLDVVSALNPSLAVELVKETFSVIDLLFYGIAVYQGYRFSILKPPSAT